MFCDSSFIFHSHSVSIGRVFGLSFAQQRLFNRRHPYLLIYVVAANAISKNSPYTLPDFYVVKFSYWNIFVGRWPYEKFSTWKFFQWKFHITKISRFVVCGHIKLPVVAATIYICNLVPRPCTTPWFYLAAMEKNREKTWDQNYVTDRKWWTRLVQTKSMLRTNRVHHFRSVT